VTLICLRGLDDLLRNEYSFRMAAMSTALTAGPPDKREALLDAALELFAERGFYGTAVPLVAERAKVGAGTVYRYFANKEALVNALFQREKTALGEVLQEALAGTRPVREHFRRLWGALWSFAEQRPQALRFLDLHHHEAYLDPASRAVEARVMLPIVEYVARAQAEQALKPMPPAAAISMVYGAFIGLAKAAWQGHVQLAPETLAQAEACLWEALRL
jgi:TetR/AcrR family transcriptional regulator, repressor of fatR-cypB operon